MTWLSRVLNGKKFGINWIIRVFNCLSILNHTSNAKCFRNVSFINIRGLAEIIVLGSGAMADIHPIRL